MLNNPVPVVLLTIFLVIGLVFGCLSGITEWIKWGALDEHNANNMFMTATQGSLAATSAVNKSTQDNNSFILTETAMPQQLTANVQSLKLTNSVLENNATQAAFAQNLQATATADQIKVAQTANAQSMQSTLDVEKFEATGAALRLNADKEQYKYHLAQTMVVIQQGTDAKNNAFQIMLVIGIALFIVLLFTLTLSLFGWYLINTRNANASS